MGAAKFLRAAGLTFKVFEAMNRIGGRAWTSSEHFGVPFDVGCAWLHAADRNPYFAEAEAASWTLHYHDMNVDHLYYRKRKASEAEETAMKVADARLYELIESHTGEDDRLSALLAKGNASRAAATFAGPMDFGADEDEISIADFKAAADLEPNYFTKEGFGALVARFGADVPVELSTPVRKILWDGSGRRLRHRPRHHPREIRHRYRVAGGARLRGDRIQPFACRTRIFRPSSICRWACSPRFRSRSAAPGSA